MGAQLLGRSVKSEELMWAICWVLIVIAIGLLMLIKGCVCAPSSTCQTMLAECERGLEAMVNAHHEDDGGCE